MLWFSIVLWCGIRRYPRATKRHSCHWLLTLSVSSRQRTRLAATEDVQAALDLHEREKQERVLVKRSEVARAQFMLAAATPPKMFVSRLQRATYQGPRQETEDAEMVRHLADLLAASPLPWERLSGQSQETPPYWVQGEGCQRCGAKSVQSGFLKWFWDGARAAS